MVGGILFLLDEPVPVYRYNMVIDYMVAGRCN